MSLSNEAIIALVALVFTLAPLLDYLWRFYTARQQALAVRRASLDTESTFALVFWTLKLVL